MQLKIDHQKYSGRFCRNTYINTKNKKNKNKTAQICSLLVLTCIRKKILFVKDEVWSDLMTKV